MSRLVIVAAFVAGCGSNWNIGQSDQLIVDCLTERRYFQDADADGWGDPAQIGKIACGPEGTLTATNQRDCDDGNASITGRVGALCPDELVAGDDADVQFGAAVAGEGEFVWVFGTTPLRSYQEASDACAMWAEHPYPLNENTQFGLATFDPSTSAFVDVQQQVLESLVDNSGGGSFAAWVGVWWEGDLDTGRWSWEDNSNDSLIDDIGFCEGVSPRPEDFFPNMYIDDPEHREVILEELERLRLALVLTDAGGWCLGLPDAANSVDAGAYGIAEAHMLCERPPADPTAYEPVESGEETTDGT
jgi:hypothetical protein